MKKKIGFFGGTFDPIHFGHIHLAVQLFEIHHLDEVLFCPAYCSPFKRAAPPHANAQHRFEMVRLALGDIPHFRLTNYEIERNEYSYTIDTLRALMSEEKGQFYLLLSVEAATHFEQWKNVQQLIHLAPPLIGARTVEAESLPKILRSSFTKTTILEISSTDVRARLKKKLYCGHLVPQNVLHYIEDNGLYQ